MDEFSERLKCRWVSWSVLGARELRLDLPVHNCTDMGGAIAVATALMPDVELIRCFEDSVPDTCYIRRGKEWFARNPKYISTKVGDSNAWHQ